MSETSKAFKEKMVAELKTLADKYEISEIKVGDDEIEDIIQRII